MKKQSVQSMIYDGVRDLLKGGQEVGKAIGGLESGRWNGLRDCFVRRGCGF